MKKLFALLVAMMMAFSCTFALAEEPAPEQAMPAFEIPSFTLTQHVEVNTDALMGVMAATGVDESTLAMSQMLLPLLAHVDEQLIFADNGLQFDLRLQEQEVFSLLGEMTENGFALITNLLPSYKLTLSNDAVGKMVEQFMTQVQDAQAQLDMELIQTAMMNFVQYAMEMANDYQTAAVVGEPVPGEYPLTDDLVFNLETPIAIDMQKIMASQQEFIGKVAADESIKAAVDSILALIPGASFDWSELKMEEIPEDKMPEVSVLVYSLVDDEGQPASDITYVAVTVLTKDEEVPEVYVNVFVGGGALNVSVEVPAKETAVQLYGEMIENGVTGNLAISAPELDMDISFVATMTEAGVLIDTAVYMGDGEDPIVTENWTFTFGGQRTKTIADAGLPELALDGLLDEETAPEVLGNLMMDLMINGIGNVMEGIKTASPEAGAVLEQMVNGIMSMFMGVDTVEEAPVEEAPAA